MIRINQPTLSAGRGVARLSTSVITSAGRRELWYETNEQHVASFAQDRCDGFVVAVLVQAARAGHDIHVAGRMSSRLWHNLTQFAIPLLTQTFAELKTIRIEADELSSTTLPGTGVATGFSAGIDSYAAVIQHHVREKQSDHRISHFLFNNVGSHGHGSPEQDRQLFRRRLDAARPAAEVLGVPVIAVDSNIAEVFPYEFIKLHSAANAAVPLVLQNGLRRFLYASAYSYAACGIHKSDDIAYLDPLIFHLFSTEALDCASTGCQLTRVEKTDLVSMYEPSYRHLNVCASADGLGGNCSVCFKCSRTILTLELLGKLDLYKDVFDMHKFAAVRGAYVRGLFRAKPGSLEDEVAALAASRGRAWWTSLLRLSRALVRC